MFYDQVLALCHSRGIKPTSLARTLGLSPSSPKRWEQGSQPKADVLQKIADYFGVSVDYLLSENVSRSIGDVSNSVVLQGSNSNNTVMNGVEVSQQTETQLTEQEAELLRIFRSLGMRSKNTALTLLYKLEDEEA